MDDQFRSPDVTSEALAPFGCVAAVGTRLCRQEADGTPGWYCVEHDRPVAIHAGNGYSAIDILMKGQADNECHRFDLATLHSAHARGLQGNAGDVFLQFLPPRPLHRLPRRQSTGTLRGLVRLLRS